MSRDEPQIAVAQVRPLVTIARVAPRLADRLVQRAMPPSIEASGRAEVALDGGRLRTITGDAPVASAPNAGSADAASSARAS